MDKDYNAIDEIATVSEYFKKNNMDYALIAVLPKSNDPKLSHLFEVVAQKTTEPFTYAAWVRWDAKRQFLTDEHSGYADIRDAYEVVYNHFDDCRPNREELEAHWEGYRFNKLPAKDKFNILTHCLVRNTGGWDLLPEETKTRIYEDYGKSFLEYPYQDGYSILSPDFANEIQTAISDYRKSQEVVHTCVSLDESMELWASGEPVPKGLNDYTLEEWASGLNESAEEVSKGQGSVNESYEVSKNDKNRSER